MTKQAIAVTVSRELIQKIEEEFERIGYPTNRSALIEKALKKYFEEKNV